MVLWGGVSLAVLIAISGVLITAGKGLFGERVGAEESCVVVLVADRSASSARDDLSSQRANEARAVLEGHSDCAYAIISEIKQFYGQAEIAVVPLLSDSDIWAERIEHERDALDRARTMVDEIFNSEAGGRTNLLATLEEVADQVNAISPGAQVHAYFWWDGIQSVAPLNFWRVFAKTSDVFKVLDTLRRIPPCPGWAIHFVGISRTARGRLPEKVVEGADAFWPAFIERCGGSLESYSATLGSPS